MKFSYEHEPTEIEVLQERIARLESVVADLIKTVGEIDTGSDYYTTSHYFQDDTRNFKFDHYDRDKK